MTANQTKPVFASHADEIRWHLEHREDTTAPTGEGPESAEEMQPTTYTCWDCGSEFVPKDERQRECTPCYVERKL